MLPPAIDRLGADAVLFPHVRNRLGVGLPQDHDHLLVRESGLLHLVRTFFSAKKTPPGLPADLLDDFLRRLYLRHGDLTLRRRRRRFHDQLVWAICVGWWETAARFWAAPNRAVTRQKMPSGASFIRNSTRCVGPCASSGRGCRRGGRRSDWDKTARSKLKVGGSGGAARQPAGRHPGAAPGSCSARCRHLPPLAAIRSEVSL